MSEDVRWGQTDLTASEGVAPTCQIVQWLDRWTGPSDFGRDSGCSYDDANHPRFHRLNELTREIPLGLSPGNNPRGPSIQARVLILKRLRVANDLTAQLADEDWTICPLHARYLTAPNPIESMRVCCICQQRVDPEFDGHVIEPLMQDVLTPFWEGAITGQAWCRTCRGKITRVVGRVTASESLPVALLRQRLIEQGLPPPRISAVPGPSNGLLPEWAVDVDALRNLAWTTVSLSEAFALTSHRVPTLRWMSRDQTQTDPDLTVRECIELFLTWKSARRRALRNGLIQHYRQRGLIHDWEEHRICSQLCLGIFEKVENLYLMSVDNEKKTGFWSKMKTFLALKLTQVVYIPKDAEESDSLMSVIYQEDTDDPRPITLCLSCPDVDCQSCRELVQRPYFSAYSPYNHPLAPEDTTLSLFVSCQFRPFELNLISQTSRVPSLRLLTAGLNQKTKAKVIPEIRNRVSVALVLDFYLTYMANEPETRPHRCHLFYMDFRTRHMLCSTSKERFLDKVMSVRARIDQLIKVAQSGTSNTNTSAAEKLRKLLSSPFSRSEPINEPDRQGFLISVPPRGSSLVAQISQSQAIEFVCCSCVSVACTGTCLIPLVPLNANLTCESDHSPLISTRSQVLKSEPVLNQWLEPQDMPLEHTESATQSHTILNGISSFYSRSPESVQMYLNSRDLNGILEYLNCQPLESSLSWQVSRLADDEILLQREDKEVRAELQYLDGPLTKISFRGNALSYFQDELLLPLLKMTSSYLVADGDFEVSKYLPDQKSQACPIITNGHYPKMETQDHFALEEDVKIETLDFHSMVEGQLSLEDLTNQMIQESTDDVAIEKSPSPIPNHHSPFEDIFSHGCDTPPPRVGDATKYQYTQGNDEVQHQEGCNDQNCHHPKENGYDYRYQNGGELLKVVVPPIMKKPKIESVVTSNSSTKVIDEKASEDDHKTSNGVHSVVCKIGRFSCPICGTIYRLNQPYGKHVANRDCTKTKHDKRTPTRDEFTLLYVMIHPGREGTDSTIGYGRVPSLRLLCRGIQMDKPCIPPSRLPPLTNKECLEINFSLKRSDKAFEREERWKYLTQRYIFHHIGNCVMFLNLGNNVLKVVDLLEKKIKAAKTKSNHPLVQQWNQKLTTYLGMPFHDNLSTAKVGKFKAYEYPSLDGSSVQVLCLNCPKTDCYGCAEMGSNRGGSISKRTATQQAANKKKKKKLVLKRGNKHQRDYYAAVGVWKTKAKLKEARQSVGQALGYKRVATYAEVINYELKLRAALQNSSDPSRVQQAVLTDPVTFSKPGPKSKKPIAKKVQSKSLQRGSLAPTSTNGGGSLFPPLVCRTHVPIHHSNHNHQIEQQEQNANHYEQCQKQHEQDPNQLKHRHLNGQAQHLNHHHEQQKRYHNQLFGYASPKGANDCSHTYAEESVSTSNELHAANFHNASNQQHAIFHNQMSPWMSTSSYNGCYEQPEADFRHEGMLDDNECILPD